MYAQVTESDSAAAPRGDQPRGSAEVVNGVTPEPRGPDTSGEGMISGMGNPNLLDSVQLGDRPEPTMTANDLLQPPRVTDPPYGNSDMGAHVMTTVDQAPNTVLANGQTMQTPATPTSSTVRVQELFTARSPPGQEAQGIRWMARFSEFLRTTATRGVNSMDRMLDGLGIPQLPATARPANVSSSTPTLRMNVSPPEELPATVAAIPGSWATTAVQEQPLFGPVQMAQMRQAQLEFPQLYGPVTGPSQGSEGESERSSRLQAEVQRQLEEYQQRYQGEMERLQREVVRLREERDGERLRRQAERALGGLPQSSNVPEGNHGHLPQSPNIPEGNHGHLPQSSHVPEGNHGPLPGHRSELQGPTLPQSSHVPEGNHGHLPQSSHIPEGNHGTLPLPLRMGVHGAVHPGLLPGQQAVPKHADVGYLQLPPLPQSSHVPGGNHGPLPQSSNVPGGNHGPLPQSSNVPGGNHGPLPQGSDGNGTSGHPVERGEAQESNGRSAQQWLEGHEPQDKMALLASGITQLQAAMLKQYDKSKEGEESREYKTWDKCASSFERAHGGDGLRGHHGLDGVDRCSDVGLVRWFSRLVAQSGERGTEDVWRMVAGYTCGSPDDHAEDLRARRGTMVTGE